MFCIFLVYTEINSPSQFKEGQCVQSINDTEIRKITQVKKFRYEYVLFIDNKYSLNKFYMNYKDFNNLMKEIQCPN